jgi:hypothetical protein
MDHDSNESARPNAGDHGDDAGGGCCDWTNCCADLKAKTEKLVREDPAKAIGLALFGGVLLTVLPIGRVLTGLIRLTLALARPLLLVLGAVKLYEEVQKKQNR